MINQRLKTELTLYDINLDIWDGSSQITYDLEDLLWTRQSVELKLCLDWSHMKVWSYSKSLLHPYTPFTTAPYLQYPRHLARQCACLCTLSHNLAIERLCIGNRWKYHTQRICQFCDAGVVENEFHTFVFCTDTQHIHDQFPSLRPISIIPTCLAVPSLQIA
jgi:hypothetical protein